MTKYRCSDCREEKGPPDIGVTVVTEEGARYGFCDECIDTVYMNPKFTPERPVPFEDIFS